MKAKPFAKWAGGKRQLLPKILPFIPEQLKSATYYEPFIGAGALFFELAHGERFYDAVIADVNTDLMEVYTVIRDSVEELIPNLKAHKERHNLKHYEATRDLEAFTLGTMLPVERAARMIYLNRTGWNGLHRVNKLGRNNVPMGKYKNPTVCNKRNLRAVSAALRYQVKILACDFATAVEIIGPGDVCYFDPPYLPREGSDNFTTYTKEGFSYDDHARLAKLAVELVRQGVTVIASNSDAAAVRDLWGKPFEIHTVQATRRINRDGTKRGPVTEILAVAKGAA